jgi:hypothetical protein
MPVSTRPTMRERADLEKAERREELRIAIAEGRIKIRQMTPAEHAEADVRKAAHAAARAARPPRTGR